MFTKRPFFYKGKLDNAYRTCNNLKAYNTFITNSNKSKV